MTEKFASIDLHPDAVSNAQMGLVFEELIRKFAELSNETAGEHFTPREVIRLMVNLLFIEDDEALSKPGVVRTIYDPTAGTGGMLSVADEHLSELNPKARLAMFGQELNAESYAICKADMLIKGQDIANIIARQHAVRRRPAAASSSTTCSPIRRSAWSGRRSRRRSARSTSSKASTAASAPACRACRTARCCSCCTCSRRCARPRTAAAASASCSTARRCSPAAPGSGESEIRRYVLENDLLEAIVALPTDMFYNTGIATYVWIVTNRKPDAPQGQGAAHRRQSASGRRCARAWAPSARR